MRFLFAAFAFLVPFLDQAAEKELLMKIAISSDCYYPIIDLLIEDVKKRGHEVHYFGPRNEKDLEIDWPEVTAQAVEEIRKGRADEAIILCWTGTGCSIIANKMGGIRAALCVDAETAKGARIYNHANVLALSLRLTSAGMLKEILEAWFNTPFGKDAWNVQQVKRVNELEEREKK